MSGSAAEPVRLLLVDDDALVRAGLRAVLASAPDLRVVGEAGDGADAIDAVLRHRPDVVLMDVRMPRMDGLAATAALTARPDAPRVLVLTTFDLDEHVFGALQAGASGFLRRTRHRGSWSRRSGWSPPVRPCSPRPPPGG
ncbi:response regulator transcription factor [Modestobacter sp. KNN46-3]|jgi:DNA-binding NarL/FixJ family response regulator|uniref:response regulator n=1 Tax=Modestobacter sp. KNN46-3 TaxID=2711218 RepID=UPI0032176EC9